MKVDEVLACALPNWYDRFTKVTFKSEVIPIPDEVLKYLQEQGSLVLPKECQKYMERNKVVHMLK